MKQFINDTRRGQRIIDRRPNKDSDPLNFHSHHVRCHMVWCGCIGRGFAYTHKTQRTNIIKLKIATERYNYGSIASDWWDR